jgi:diadenosine tetraphosphate (Ap4A) HIT family hydrolase
MIPGDTLAAAQSEGRAPWTQIVTEEQHYVVFQDGFPVSPGHLLFVPRRNWLDDIMACYRAAHVYGDLMMCRGDVDGYNVGINRGEAAGQTVMYPHVHLIPRRRGDCADPVGGVRGVIPGQANYRSDSYRSC